MAKQTKKDEKRTLSNAQERKVDSEMRAFLLEKAEFYERAGFIEDDPISVPHRFSNPRDVELAGFIAASLAWGQRKTILKSASKFIERMDNAPSEFIGQATPAELKRASADFVHRTFQPRDAEVFLHALQGLMKQHGTLEEAFLVHSASSAPTAEDHLCAFHDRFFEAAAHRGFEPGRTQKHVASPRRGSATKRLNMFLRWMVRSNARGVDFGIWKAISPAQLMIPLDVHTGNVGRKLGLLDRKASDWKAVEELMESLRQIDSADPVRLDFALFGLGAIEGF